MTPASRHTTYVCLLCFPLSMAPASITLVSKPVMPPRLSTLDQILC